MDCSALLTGIPKQLEQSRELAVVGKYEDSALYYDGILNQLQQ
jgi:hypothetical protein